MRKILILIAALLMLVGCSVQKYKDESKYHQIAANTNGNYLSLSDNINWQCGLNIHLDNIVKRIKAHPLSEDGKRRVLISIHGGLNGINSNFKRVQKHYEDAIDDGYYPIFVSWRSGALTTLNDRYFGVRNGVDRPKWITIPSSPFYLASDLLRGIAAIPESVWDQGANFSETHLKRIRGYDETDINNIQSDFESINFYYTGRGSEKSLREQTEYTVRQIIPGVTRIVTTPLIEGAANKSWEVMLRRAKTLVYRQGDLTYRGIGKYHYSKNPVPNKCESEANYFETNGPNGVVAQLMRAIQEISPAVDVTLVGHSMGAIIANDIVGEFPTIKYEKIIHMASADSIRNLMSKTMPILDEENAPDFYNLTLHPTNEEQEQSAFGTAPEGSLLIWLDYILTNPETTLDRRAGRWENIKWAFPFFEDKKKMHFKLFGLRNKSQYSGKYKSPTDFNADQSEPLTHGDFGDYKFWREEFYWKDTSAP